MQTPQRLDTIFIWFTPNGPKCLTNCQPKSLQPKTEKTVKKNKKKKRRKTKPIAWRSPSTQRPPEKKNSQTVKRKKKLELGERNRMKKS